MAVELNSRFLARIQNTSLEPLFFTEGDSKTIVLVAKRGSNPDQEHINNLINKIKSIVTSVAKIYEWDSWLEFEVKFIDEEIDE